MVAAWGRSARKLCAWQMRLGEREATLTTGGRPGRAAPPALCQIALPTGEVHLVEADRDDTVRVEREMLHLVSGDSRAVGARQHDREREAVVRVPLVHVEVAPHGEMARVGHAVAV